MPCSMRIMLSVFIFLFGFSGMNVKFMLTRSGKCIFFPIKQLVSSIIPHHLFTYFNIFRKRSWQKFDNQRISQKQHNLKWNDNCGEKSPEKILEYYWRWFWTDLELFKHLLALAVRLKKYKRFFSFPFFPSGDLGDNLGLWLLSSYTNEFRDEHAVYYRRWLKWRTNLITFWLFGNDVIFPDSMPLIFV